MRKKSIIVLLLLLCNILNAQEKFTISGHIKDAATGEELIGATIFVKELMTGGITNVYGFYSVTIPAGEYTIEYSYIGYETQKIEIYLNQSTKKNVELLSTGISLQEVVVTAEVADKNVKSTEMSVVKITPKEIKAVPVLFGEQDILKTLQLMPGVKSAGEGSSGFYVRGGGSDQNLILLDEAPVYNASHLMGFFSVFNSDAIKDMKLYKGNAPAEFGGRLSSVLDVKMNEGNSKRFSTSGGIGLISSRLTIESPIVKNKGSFIITGRRTYADLLLKLSSDESLKNTVLYFYDFNMKANYRLNQNNRIFLSGYFGNDVLDMDGDMGFDWGNTTATFRWNHLFSDKLFLNSTIIYSKYKYMIGIMDDNIYSSIQDYNLKEDFQYFLNTRNTLKFGFNSIYHTFSPGKLSSDVNPSKNKEIDNKYALENAAYISHSFDINPVLKINYGLRYSMFSYIGAGNVYTYNDEGGIIDTTSYKSGELIKNYGGFEPRFLVNYLLNEKSSVKFSYTRNRQYIHLITNFTSSSNIDIWQPSTNIVEPEIADQLALGYFRNLKQNKFETSVEIYYKNLQNQIDIKDGAEIIMNEKVESELVFGNGYSYGIEFFLRKKVGKLTGWLSYTWSKTERQFDEINNGDFFPAVYDRTHDVSIVGIYNFTKRLSVSATWVYYTGNAVTYPVGRYEIGNQIVPVYSDRNSQRMPDYHRLDIGLTLKNKKKRKFESSWNFSIYNVYARQNAYTISFRSKENSPMETEAVQMSLFSIVPSITYNFKF